MIKKLICATLALVSAGIAFGQCPLTFTGSNQAIIGVYVCPINSDQPIVNYNSEQLMTPASVMKSVTVAAALTKCGGDYRWQTTVSSVGSISNGVLHGNLEIAGSGDPTLGSGQFHKEREGFLSALRNAAVKSGFSSISGNSINTSAWPDQGPIPSWEIEDIPGIDGAGFYSLNWNDNVFSISIPSMRTTPNIPGLKIRNLGGRGGLKYFRNPGSYDMTITGMLNAKQKQVTFICSMPNPPEVLLSQIDSLFDAKGKKADGCGEKSTLLVYKSPHLRDVVRSLMVRSDNQMAEATLRLLEPGKPRDKAITTERAILSDLGVDLSGAKIADGSGLSRHNAISPRQLGQILIACSGNADYVGSFARVGKDGTVRNMLRNVPGSDCFVLKSGSMTGVICYVGYRLDPATQKPTHAIAIMINNAPNSKAARAAISDFLVSLKEL